MNQDFIDQLQRLVSDHYRGAAAVNVKIDLNTGSKLRAKSIPPPRPEDLAVTVTVTNHEPVIRLPAQKAILKALKGKAMKSTDLGKVVGDKRKLYQPGAIKELLDEGIVAHIEGLGYYRTDYPPPDLLPDPEQQEDSDET